MHYSSQSLSGRHDMTCTLRGRCAPDPEAASLLHEGWMLSGIEVHVDNFAWMLRLDCLVVPTSDPVNVPRRRTSISEEQSAGNVSQPASAERSLLSQQIRLNSDTSLSQMSSGTAAHVRPDAVEAQVGSSHQSFPSVPVPKQESGNDEGSQLSNGGLHATSGALQNGPPRAGFHEQPAESQSQSKGAPSIDWQSDPGEQQQKQVRCFDPSDLPMTTVDHSCKQ